MERLEKLWRGIRGTAWIPPTRMLALDPGGTTGWAVAERGILAHCGQVEGTADRLQELLDLYSPTLVLHEEYRLYPWKAKEQSFSDMPVSRLIGGLEVLCAQRGIPLVGQGANDAKGSITDTRLKELHLYQSSKRHANDAIRHAVYALACNKTLPQGLEEDATEWV